MKKTVFFSIFFLMIIFQVRSSEYDYCYDFEEVKERVQANRGTILISEINGGVIEEITAYSLKKAFDLESVEKHFIDVTSKTMRKHTSQKGESTSNFLRIKDRKGIVSGYPCDWGELPDADYYLEYIRNYEPPRASKDCYSYQEVLDLGADEATAQQRYISLHQLKKIFSEFENIYSLNKDFTPSKSVDVRQLKIFDSCG